MKKHNWESYVLWAALSLTVGGLSGYLSRRGIQSYLQQAVKPPLSPPEILFPIVWSLLYLLMGIGAARVSLAPEGKSRNQGLNLFWLQLAVNFLWSPIFFLYRVYGLAFFWLLLLLALVLAMTLSFRETDPLAAKLQIPYLLWLSFAAYLNLGVWYLNR